MVVLAPLKSEIYLKSAFLKKFAFHNSLLVEILLFFVKMSIYIQQLTYYQRNRDTILRKAKEHYEKNKEKKNTEEIGIVT